MFCFSLLIFAGSVDFLVRKIALCWNLFMIIRYMISCYTFPIIIWNWITLRKINLVFSWVFFKMWRKPYKFKILICLIFYILTAPFELNRGAAQILGNFYVSEVCWSYHISIVWSKFTVVYLHDLGFKEAWKYATFCFLLISVAPYDLLFVESHNSSSHVVAIFPHFVCMLIWYVRL